jgi:hypothetical protein
MLLHLRMDRAPASEALERFSIAWARSTQAPGEALVSDRSLTGAALIVH